MDLHSLKSSSPKVRIKKKSWWLKRLKYWNISLCRALWRILQAKMENLAGLKCILVRWNKPIKNENQIIVRSKQPIKIEKPFQSLLTFSHSACEKNMLQSVLLSFFSVFIFSMPSKVILIVIEFMFGAKNMVWVRLRLILARAARWENVNKLWNGFWILIGCLDGTIIWCSFFIALFQRAKIDFSSPNSPF